LTEDAGELLLPSLPLLLFGVVEEARDPMRGIRRIGRKSRRRGVSALQQLIMKLGMVFLENKKLKLFPALKHSFSLIQILPVVCCQRLIVQYHKLTIFAQLKVNIFDHQASSVDPE
jgi:hypothetical protein